MASDQRVLWAAERERQTEALTGALARVTGAASRSGASVVICAATRLGIFGAARDSAPEIERELLRLRLDGVIARWVEVDAAPEPGSGSGRRWTATLRCGADVEIRAAQRA